MNNTNLKKIYLRGYLANDIQNIKDGLLKASKGGYAFFASGQMARKEIRNISNYKCVSDLVEIPILSTINEVAFPMSKLSPYKKVINLR